MTAEDVSRLLPLLIAALTPFGAVLIALARWLNVQSKAIDDMRFRLKLAEDELSKAETEVQQVKEQLETNAARRQLVEKTLETVNAEKLALTNKVAEQSLLISELKLQMESFDAKLRVADEKIETLTTEHSADQASIRKLREDLAEEQQKRQQTEAALRKAEEENAALRASHTSEINQLNQEITELKRQVTILQADLEEQRRKFASQEVPKVEVPHESSN